MTQIGNIFFEINLPNTLDSAPETLIARGGENVCVCVFQREREGLGSQIRNPQPSGMCALCSAEVDSFVRGLTFIVCAGVTFAWEWNLAFRMGFDFFHWLCLLGRKLLRFDTMYVFISFRYPTLKHQVDGLVGGLTF